MRIRLLACATVVLLAACVPLEPIRHALPDRAGAGCAYPQAGSACSASITESTPQYDLHFVEFDDQGLQYPEQDGPRSWTFDAAAVPEQACDPSRNDCLFRRAWAYQINNLMKQLNKAADGDQLITLVVFIHGWKHNAGTDDDNVIGFRRFLATAALMEDALSHEPGTSHRPRRIVGVYVGWRGQSIDVRGLEELTFWSRKSAAQHVAEGSSRELFARLRGFKCVQNSRDQEKGKKSCVRPPADNDPVKVVLIGHSFGGLVLYNAISGSLIESMTHAFDANDEPAPYWRFADLAVLINPAFEATRYTPLQRIASTTTNDHYEPPMLITVTSTTDRATGMAFPVGRFVNTLFERESGEDEHTANRETIGHHDLYLTHRLEVTPDPVGPGATQCAGWLPIEKTTPPADAARILATDLPIEFRNSKAFFERMGRRAGDGQMLLGTDRWVRDFCGGVRLTSMTDQGNSPIWNVSVVGHPDLLPNHSDITEPLFVAFFRQIYMDTLYLEGMTRDVRLAR